MKTIGLDIGTTTISAVVMDNQNHSVVQARTIANGSFIDNGNEWERIQDVTVIIPKAKALLDELLEVHTDVKAIGLTGQMHGILYLNDEGRCISPLYTWQDGRGDLPVDALGGVSAVAWIRDTFDLPAATGFGLVTNLYHTKTGQVPADAKCMCTAEDYLGMLLTGRSRPLIHSSNAASFGFYDSKNGCFLKDVIARSGMDCSMLPEVTDAVAVLGEYHGIPVTVALGDNQASFMGSVGMEEECWLLNVGTGGQSSVLSDTFFEAPGIESRPYIDGKYLLVGCSLCAGRSYAILEKFFRAYAKALGAGDEEQYAVMEKLIAGEDLHGDHMQVVTKFKGTRTDPDVRGSITGLSEDNFTPQSMIIGVLSGMAQELYDMYSLIHEGTGIRVKRLLGSGNGVRKNKTLQTIFSEMFGCALELSPFEEEAASGAAVSAAFAVKA